MTALCSCLECWQCSCHFSLFHPPPNRHQHSVLLVFLSVYSTQFLPFQPYCSNPASYLELSLKIALPVLSQIISISAFPNYLLFFPSMVKMWPSSLLILAVLVCLGTSSRCLSPHQCQTPHPCFLYLFLFLVPSSSFQFLCSSPHIRFTSFCPVGCLEAGMSSCSSMMCMLSLFQGERRKCCSSPCLCECVPHVAVRAEVSSACATCVPFLLSSRWQERAMMKRRRSSERYQPLLSFPAA